MAVETQQENTVTEIEARIQRLTEDGRQEMQRGGGNLGNAAWKNPLGVLSAWAFTQTPFIIRSPDIGDAFLWIGEAAFAALSLYSGFRDIFEGIHHVRSHSGIMKEISSHRVAISRRFEELLHHN